MLLSCYDSGSGLADIVTLKKSISQVFLHISSNKSVKTAVPDDGPPGAIVLTKLVEESRFEVGDDKLLFFCGCVLCVFGV